MCQVNSVPLCTILEQNAEWVQRGNKYNVEGSEINVEIILALDGSDRENVR
jgi:hypothetical protein